MLILTVVLVLSVLASCDLMHEHVFAEWESINEPTCTSLGLKKRSCECGYVEYDAIAARPHNLAIDAATPATCTAPGKTEGSHCADCGAVISKQTETSKLPHGFSEWVTETEPTCTSFGLKKRSCECGEVEYCVLDALAHTPVTDAATPATCTVPGKTEGSHCSTCGAIITVQSNIAATGHTCDDITVLNEALCNLDGVKRYSCTNADCDYYYDESYSLDELAPNEIFDIAAQYTGVISAYDRFENLLSSSTAFVISADGKIVAGAIRIDNAYSVVFTLGENSYNITDILAYDDNSAVAVLKIDATGLPYAKTCAREPLNGETVYSIGTPEGLPISISRGIVSKSNVVVRGVNMIQHDAELNENFEGGPLLNRFGEVIGMNGGNYGTENVSVSISAIEALDYSSPMSMQELYNLTYTPAEQLNDWVNNNYIATAEDSIAYVVQGNGFYYSLGYDTQKKVSFAEGYWEREGNYQLYTKIFFDNSVGTYQYYATLTDGRIKNETNGYIDAASYTASTVLTYDTFYGKYWTESELITLYSKAVYDTLGFFSYCLDTYFDTLTLETFGFTSVSYDRDETALTKLQNFLQTVGEYEPITGSYVLSGGTQTGNDVMTFNISYHIETGDTVVSVHNSLASGATYSAYLTLNSNENGNRFDFMYSLYNGEEYILQNMAWGYLDANTFTALTKLTCYVFEGMNEYEDGLLVDYMPLLDFMMKLLNDSVMPGISPELSVKDLGFFFYFG